MATTNTSTSLAAQAEPAAELARVMRSETTIQKFQEIMSKPEAMAYISTVILEVMASPDLQKCSVASIIRSAMKAAALRLSCDRSLGQAYLAPFNNKVKGRDGQPDRWEKQCTMILGYRGIEQLALRTRKYRYINVFPVYEGQEYIEQQLTGKAEIKGMRKKGGEVLGYGLYFELLDGFSHSNYMTVDEILDHAKTYSKSYDSTFWQDEKKRVEMMRKTPLRLGLLRYGEINPFDRAILERVEDEEEESAETVEGSFMVSSEPELPARSEADLLQGLTHSEPDPIKSMSIGQLKTRLGELNNKANTAGVSADEMKELDALKAEIATRK
jgi:phage RecT family recombinase